jgi:hypothetical protein
MKYYFRDIDTLFGVVRNIISDAGGSRLQIFIDNESNTGSERQAYLAWVAEGNTAEEWDPENQVEF